MTITINTDATGQIWRYVDGVPHEHLVLCPAEEAQAQGLVRYGDAYLGERWDTPGMVIRPEHVPYLYIEPPVPPVVEPESRHRAAAPESSAEPVYPEPSHNGAEES